MDANVYDTTGVSIQICGVFTTPYVVLQEELRCSIFTLPVSIPKSKAKKYILQYKNEIFKKNKTHQLNI
jgi:hypothetical protein